MANASVTVSKLLGPKPGNRVQLVGGGSTGIALYTSKTGPGTSKISVSNRMPYETVLLPVNGLTMAGLGSGAAWPTVIIPQWLPAVPEWCLAAAADGSLAGAVQVFGGGANALLVGIAKQGTLDIPAIYDREDYTQLRMLRGAPPATAIQAYVGAIADGAVLKLFSPVYRLLPAGGSRLIQAIAGVALQDSPESNVLWIVYLQGGGRAAILSERGAALGRLNLTSFDRSLNSAGLTMPIIDRFEVAEFDADKRGDMYCLLASTPDGARLLLFNDNGDVTPLAWPVEDFGRGHWLTSPTVQAVRTGRPDTNAAQLPAFLFAFVEMAGDEVLGFRLGAVTLT